MLVLLVAGSVELGRALFGYLAAEQAVRGGARYLARVSNPTCTPACSWGAAYAVSLTQRQIVESTGIAATAVKVAPVVLPPIGTVVMRADVEVSSELLTLLGLPYSWTMTVSHQEQRIEE